MARHSDKMSQHAELIGYLRATLQDLDDITWCHQLTDAKRYADSTRRRITALMASLSGDTVSATTETRTLPKRTTHNFQFSPDNAMQYKVRVSKVGAHVTQVHYAIVGTDDYKEILWQDDGTPTHPDTTCAAILSYVFKTC